MSDSRTGRDKAAGDVPLGSTGLTVSRIGFGCYRVDDQTPEHRAALDRALDSGCTLIDTSTNYTDGASERLVGEALADLRQRDARRRFAVTIVSKVGYVQGRNMSLAMERESAGRPFPGMVKYMDGCWHCVHPEFLADQLDRSRRRLQVETLDVCLLHNPEYFLSDARKRRPGEDLETTRDAFYARLRDAFEFMEARVKAGDIRFYGVSSNSAVSPAGDPEATSVSRMLEAAAAAGGGEHHFRVLQIPMNLLEPGGARVRNSGPDNGRTALEEAAAAGVGVLINRPLNAIVNDRLLRLASPDVPPPGTTQAEAVATLEVLEQEHKNDIAPRIDRASAEAAGQLFQLVDQLVEMAPQVEDAVHWKQLEQQYVIPRVNFVAGAVARGIAEEHRPRWQAWWSRFSAALQDLLYDIGRRASQQSLGPALEIAAAIDPALPPERRGESLSRKALWVLASTPGVSTVLVGMRRPPYVSDAMAIAAWPPLADPFAVYERMERE